MNIGKWIMNKGKISVARYAAYAAAGMKYIVITSKHHDGFVMFKSAATRGRS